MDNPNRARDLALRALAVADPEVGVETERWAPPRASDVVARAATLVNEIHVRYEMLCENYGVDPVLTEADLAVYAAQPEELRAKIRHANSVQHPERASLRVALVCIEQGFGSC